MVIVAFHYPPMLGPASQRAASFARHLPEHGWEPIVVTVRGGNYHRDDAHRPPAARTLRTRSPEPSRLIAPLRRRAAQRSDGPGTELVTAIPGGSSVEFARRFVRDFLYIPDGQTPWIPLAIAAARSALRSTTGPKVVLSTSVPFSAHIAAMAVARSEGVPWVAEFRDPWSLVDDGTRPRSRARKAIDAALERRVVDAANAVAVTTDLTREAMALAYPELPADAIWVVRNGFDESAVAAAPPRPDEPLALLQAGSVPEEVALQPLLRGIDRVARAHPGKVRLQVLAPPQRWQAAATALGDPPWLELGGLVAPDTARAAMVSASANVLLRPGERHRQYVAAKLMDYLGARRPIVGIVAPGGEMARLGASYGEMLLLGDYDERGVTGIIENLLARHRSGALQQPTQAHASLREMTRSAQAERLAGMLDSLR